MREEPLFRKCCFFLPLRICLQTWAYIKMVADVLAMSYLLFVLAILYGFGYREFFKELSVVHLLVLIVISLIVDVGFLIVLLCGIYKKNFTILRAFYFYEFFAMAAESVIVAVICVSTIDSSKGVFFVMIGVFYILLDLFIIMTVKSEMIKLRNKEQYDFSRMPVCEIDVEGAGKLKTDEK